MRRIFLSPTACLWGQAIAGLIDKNGIEVLNWMSKKGYITPTQYKSAFDSKYNLTAEAKNDLRGIVVSHIFKNGNSRLEEMFNAMPAKAQKAILATAYRDNASPEGERMMTEIQNSVRAFHALMQYDEFANARNYEAARKAVENWAKQYQYDDATGESYLPAEKFSNFALVLAAMYKGRTQKFVQDTFNDMYDLIQGAKKGDLFETPDNTPRTLAQAIKEVLNIDYERNGKVGNNGVGINAQKGKRGRRGSNGDVGGGEHSKGAEPQTDSRGRVGGDSQGDGEIVESQSFLDVVRTLYSKGKEVASKLFQRSFFDIAQTPRFMQELGLRGDKFTIKYGVIARHLSKDNSHSLSEQVWEQLPQALQNPFAISRITDRENSYHIYTTLETENGEYVVVGVDVKNAGREIEVNAISTVLGRRNNANLSKNEEVIYRSKKITPEQSSLLERPNFVQYPTVQELFDRKGTTKTENGNELGEKIAQAEAEVDTDPTDKQKEAGNYKKGHVRIGTFNITIEQPKGSVRRGVDTNGKKWEIEMQNTYGYIRGTEGVDGDHIDVFLSDDIDDRDGQKVFVVDQYNEDGSFDEHKVMLGFNDINEAYKAYLSNYENGWADKHTLRITQASLEEFEKWIDSSNRKTKEFSEYKKVKKETVANNPATYTIEPAQYTTRRGKVLDMHLVKFADTLSKEQYRAAKELAKAERGWYDAKQGGFMMRSEESAKQLADTIVGNKEAVADAQPVSLADINKVTEQQSQAGEAEEDDIFSQAERKMTYSCPELGIENTPVKQNLLRNAVEDITTNVLTGKDFSEQLEAAQRSKRHNEAELEQMLSREGKPFEYEKELKQAQAQYEEYSELMKKELEEKEAKYADMDANISTAENISNTEEDNDTLYRSDDTIKNRIEALFNQAISGEFNGKSISIGRLTDEGKAYLEQISGIVFKAKVDFVLNPSDLLHIYKDHFGNNEKDKGQNVPLDIEDIRSLSDVISNPDKVIFFKEGEGSNRNMFYFFKEAENGTYNLMEIYSDKKGNLTAKTFYKTRKGSNQRVIDIEKSLLRTSETSLVHPLSDAKIPKMFESASVEEENSNRNGVGPYTDDEISYENDPWSKLAGRPLRTQFQRKEFARKERQRMVDRVKELAEKLHLDNVDIVTDASVLRRTG